MKTNLKFTVHPDYLHIQTQIRVWSEVLFGESKTSKKGGKYVNNTSAVLDLAGNEAT